MWTNQAWKRKTELAREGFGAIEYAASSKFSRAGVGPDSLVFLVTNIKGSLFLGGYIRVEDVMNRREATNYLRLRANDLWAGREYIVAQRGSEYYFRGDLQLPDRIAHRLKFRSPRGGFVYPKLDRAGKLDRQTLRNVRRLYPGAEKSLLELLKE